MTYSPNAFCILRGFIVYMCMHWNCYFGFLIFSVTYPGPGNRGRMSPLMMRENSRASPLSVVDPDFDHCMQINRCNVNITYWPQLQWYHHHFHLCLIRYISWELNCPSVFSFLRLYFILYISSVLIRERIVKIWYIDLLIFTQNAGTIITNT